MDDGDVTILDLEHDNLPHADRIFLVVEKQNVPSLEGGLHGPTGVLGVGGREGMRKVMMRAGASQIVA